MFLMRKQDVQRMTLSVACNLLGSLHHAHHCRQGLAGMWHARSSMRGVPCHIGS